ncbi:MAG: M15 family metallopeptidase [Cyclobacteriaceae bacterium]
MYIDHTIFSDVQDILGDAVETGTYIHINSSFRTNKKQEELGGSKDAITPASAGNSPHNAGLAIDFNIYTDNDVSKGLESKNKNLKSDHAFIKKVKEKDWRYGGDFNDPDRVHIDKRGTDENFKSIRDANQTQVDGSTNKTVDDTKVKRTETITVKKKEDEK